VPTGRIWRIAFAKGKTISWRESGATSPCLACAKGATHHAFRAWSAKMPCFRASSVNKQVQYGIDEAYDPYYHAFN
jgi:hypothetical protein